MKVSSLLKPLAAACVIALGVPAHAAPATTINYMCNNRKPFAVTYRAGETRMTAQAHIDGIGRVMELDTSRRQGPTSTFRGEEQTMTMDAFDMRTLPDAAIHTVRNEVGAVRLENCIPQRMAAPVVVTPVPAQPVGDGWRESDYRRDGDYGRRYRERNPTVSYQCDNRRRVNVTYDFGEAGMRARVALNGAVRSLRWDGTQGDPEIELFRGQGYQLITDKFDRRNLRNAGVRQITRETRARVSGRMVPVSQILYRNCTPY